MAVTLIDVAPIGSRMATVHLNTGPDSGGHRWEERPMAEYPKSQKGELLMALRIGMNLTLREAGGRVALTPAQWSQVEHGHYTVSDADWEALFSAIEPKCQECGVTAHAKWKESGKKPFWLCTTHEAEMMSDAVASVAAFRAAQPAEGA